MTRLSEFDLVQRFFRAAGAARDDVIIGVGDDAAVTRVAAGVDLVSTTDALVAGVHFDESAGPGDVGHRALAVNLSDLAAMGAQPAWATLVLTLPAADEDWLGRFAEGFSALATRHRVALVGGDTVRGPLQVVVQALGLVPRGRALTRAGARPGDGVYVTGALGEAGLALEGGAGADAGRLWRPEPRVDAGLALRNLASACIDLSDGLGADLGHVLAASGAGATVRLDRLPASAALERLDAEHRWRLQTGAGDDYELCFTADPRRGPDLDRIAERLGLAIRRIGDVEAAPGLRFLRPDGGDWQPPRSGYRHFGADEDDA